jgi:hypothetical protein
MVITGKVQELRLVILLICMYRRSWPVASSFLLMNWACVTMLLQIVSSYNVLISGSWAYHMWRHQIRLCKLTLGFCYAECHAQWHHLTIWSRCLVDIRERWKMNITRVHQSPTAERPCQISLISVQLLSVYQVRIYACYIRKCHDRPG